MPFKVMHITAFRINLHIYVLTFIMPVFAIQITEITKITFRKDFSYTFHITKHGITINVPAVYMARYVHCKKRLSIFPSSAGMPLAKLEYGQWHPGWGRENRKPFFTYRGLKWQRAKRVPFGPKKVDTHCKKELAIFPSPAGMSLTKLSLAGKKLHYSRPGRV